MSGAPALSLLLSAGSLESVLVVILVILAVLVVIAIVGALFVFMRQRRPDESSARLASPQQAPPSPSGGFAAVGTQPGAGDAFASPPPIGPRVVAPSSPPSPSTPAPPAAGAPSPDPEPDGPEAAEAEPAVPEVVAAVTAQQPAVEKLEAGGAPAPPTSTTQTPEDVDQRSPAELAAAAQAAETAEEREPRDSDTSSALAVQPGVTIGPPRPIEPPAPPDPARLRMLGLTLGMLTERIRRDHPPQLGTALARLVDSDQEGARTQLSTLALSLIGEDEEPSAGESQLSLFLQEALEGEVERGFSFSSMPEFQQALSAVSPELHEKLQTIVWARNADSVAILTAEDVEALERVAVAMATAFMLETSYDVRRVPGEAPSGRP